MNTLLDYYKFFKAIPSNKWCKHRLVDNQGRHCVRGHLGTRISEGTVVESLEAIKFYQLLGVTRSIVKDINDGVNSCFQQPRPKSRILAYIKSKL